MRGKYLLAIVFTLAMAAFTITGCGQSGSTSSSAGSGSAPDASASAEASSSASAASSAAEEAFDQAAAEKEARANAEASGRTVLEGTITITTHADRAREVEPRLVNDFSSDDSEIAIIDLDSTVELYARNGDGQGSRTQKVSSICLGEDVSRWVLYDGQHVTIAVDSDTTWFPSDVSGALYSARTKTAQLIAPLTEADVASSNQDYVLPDSSTREYSESELRAMDAHTLFLARNEVYARHNRQFKNEELQQYFGSKSWYSGTISPESFDEGVLNAVEKANVNRMLEIEKSMGSPYI